MKQTIRVSIILALFLLSSSAWAQSPQPGTVTLTLDEYQALQKAAQVAKPPKDFILSQAEYQATPGENTLSVKVRLTAVVYVGGPVLVPLFGEGVRIDKATVEGKPAVLTAEDQGGVSWALLGKPGDEMTLEMEFHTALHEEQGFYNAEFAIPRAGVARLEVDYPYKEVRALLGKNAWPTTRDNRGHSILNASIGGWEKVQLSWLPLSEDAKLRMHVEELLAVDHRESGVDYNLTLNLYVSGRPLRELVLPYTKDLGLTGVQGEEVARHEIRDSKITVRFREPIYGRHKINLSFHSSIVDANSHELNLPRLVPEEATSMGGTVALVTNNLYHITIKEQENIRPVALDQIPDRRLAQDAVLAFRLWQRDYQLTYLIEKIPSEFSAALYSNISFGETTCILNTRCECLVDQGALYTFHFAIPDNFQTESVSGGQIRSWSPTPDGAGLDVVLDGAVRGKTVFSIQLRKNYEDREEIPVHLPEIDGPKRVRGFLTIAPQSTVRV